MNYELNYNGRQLKFDQKYIDNIVAAFKENALGEQTVFQLADDDNSHDTDKDRASGRHYDPQRFRGAIEDVERRADGLYVKVKPTEDGLKLLKDNPRLAVSASLREQYPSHNGKVYPVVLRHVLGTHDPKVRGMKHWEEADVALANDEDINEEVIDLTSTEPDKAKDGKKIEVDEAEWNSIQDFIKKSKEEDAELDKLVQDILNSDEEETETETETVGLSTQRDPKLIELSNQLASEQFERRADAWRREGVPNKMIELARPALSTGNEMEIELSNGSKTDGKAIIAAMLDEAKGTIDLSAQNTHTQSQEEVDAEVKDMNDMSSYFMGFGDGNQNGSIF